MTELAEKYNCSVAFWDIPDFGQYFTFNFKTSGFNSVVWARLLLLHYLPENLSEVLYLDCDVIVDGSIKELETINMSEYALAGVPELHMPKAQKKYIGLGPEDTIIINGVSD